MIYISKDDLESDSFDQFINESTGFNDTKLDKIETKAIALCKTFLTPYDVDDVFDEADPIRDEHLVQIIAKIVLFKLFSRNAARKVSTDIKDAYQWAMKELEKIQTGRITLNLPPKINTDTGQAEGALMWGNISNTNFYI